MRRSRILRSAALVAIAIAVAKVLVSCVDLDSLGNGPVRPEDAAPPSETSVPVVVDPCTHDQPAATSDASDGDGELPGFVLALNTVSFDPTRVSSPDLDGVCTCDARPGSAGDGGPSCLAATVTCDGDGGADNNFASLIESTAPIASLDKAMNRLISNGYRTLLLQIRGYNGLANDSEVIVGTLAAVGIHAKGCPSSVFESTRGVWSAGACGDDPWTLSATAGIMSSDGPVPFVRGTGYVVNHRLVVRLNAAVGIPFSGESILSFGTPVLTGDLVPLGEDLAPRDPGRAPTEREKRLFRLDNGVLAGRVLTAELLASLGAYDLGGAQLCETPAFGTIRQRVCDGADLQFKPPFDPTQSCDAVSAAVGFVAVPALPAAFSDASAPPAGCASVDAASLRCR